MHSKKRGLRAVALDRSACDVTSDAIAAELFSRHHPTLLINCAAHTKVDLCEDEPAKADAINGHAVGRLASLAREHGTFLVHYGTDFVFDGRGARPYRADDPVNPLSAYGRSKLMGERLLQDHAPAQWLILRTSWLYGRGGPNFPRTIVERRGRLWQTQPRRRSAEGRERPDRLADLRDRPGRERPWN